eukprot:TRINITY_DN4622_c0_g1_i4.p1 TRINITY_DN4622_c0_g1~~TRINITY_DN4622_c0_g1_i4.p1  ORF type:complete len:583 (+),score=168.82 TRINITY_DN4622_c0_g1_i4:350-2098(+)
MDSGVKMESRLLSKTAVNTKKKMSATKAMEFGYDDGNMFTLKSFKTMADEFKKKWFSDTEPTEEDIENTFWHIVESGDKKVQVHYGSDLDIKSHGSGFPNDLKTLSSSRTSQWNMNLFPKAKGSLLSYLPEDILGVSVPMMYMGMLFSSFCWHVEDNYLYSINYMHHGASKTWYGIPESACDKFESAMKKALPDLFEKTPNLLFLLITMFPPSMLVAENIPVCHTVQKAGEIMVTFPKGYHAGFSHGFNCGESTNFALEDWLPYGRQSINTYRNYNRSSVFSLEKLLCHATFHSSDPHLNLRLKKEVPLMRNKELLYRERAIEEGIWKAVEFSKVEKDGKTLECHFCKYDCYLSAIVCPCNPDQIACLEDAHLLCSCESKRKFLLYRYTNAELNDMVRRVGGEDMKKDVERQVERLYINEVESQRINKEQTKGVSRSLSSSSRKLNSKRGIALQKLDAKHRTDEKYHHKGMLVGISKSKIALRRLGRNAGVRKIGGLGYNTADNVPEFRYVLKRIIKKRKLVSGGSGSSNGRGRSKNGKIPTMEYLIDWKDLPKEKRMWIPEDDFLPPEMLGERPKESRKSK